MKLYRVECILESSFTATDWTNDLEKVKNDYELKKDFSIGLVRIVTIEI